MKVITAEVVAVWRILKVLVVIDTVYENSELYLSESLKSVQNQFKIGLALCLAQNVKWMSQ